MRARSLEMRSFETKEEFQSFLDVQKVKFGYIV